MQMDESDYPLLYQAADNASLKAQTTYFRSIQIYLVLLVAAAVTTYLWPESTYGAIASAALFFSTLMILVGLHIKKPVDIWYNGRAVAESVKTRSWRWIMKAEPYHNDSQQNAETKFLEDLKHILQHNRALSAYLDSPSGNGITEKMKNFRQLSWEERLKLYSKHRIQNQANWYSMKAAFNKKRARMWLVTAIILHAAAIMLLLYKINAPTLSLPIEVIAVIASAVLTWIQAKKHSELNSSYSLAAYEITLIAEEASHVNSDASLSDYILNSEAAFSREHTQWVARKSDG